VIRRTLPVLLATFLCACGLSGVELTATPYEPEPPTLTSPAQGVTPQSTQTPGPTATAKPVPTYSVDQAYQQIISWLDDNGGCRLPCVWGFTPGRTDHQDIQRVHSTFSDYYEGDGFGIWTDHFEQTGGLDLILEDEDVRTDISMDYNFKGAEQLTLLGFHANSYIESEAASGKEIREISGDKRMFDLVEYYTLPSIINHYGQPTKILIAPYYDERPEVEGPSWIWFSVVLIYEDQGILAEYIMPRRMIGDDFAACVDQNLEISIVTWDTSKALEFGEIANATTAFYGISEAFIDYFKPLEEATSLSIEEFTEIFKEPGTDACVYTPMEMWPNP
jgi:hypothetical protein